MDDLDLAGIFKVCFIIRSLTRTFKFTSCENWRRRQREREKRKRKGGPESGVGRQAPEQSEKNPVREKRGRGQGRGGRRGRRELPTIVRRLQVFLPDSRLTAGVGRGRAGLHPLPLKHLGAKGLEEWYPKTHSRKGYPRLWLSKKAPPLLLLVGLGRKLWKPSLPISFP